MKGKTILEAALQNDIYIPHLCYHPDLESIGACRGCSSSRQCELQRIMAYLHIDRRRIRRLRLPKEDLPKDTSNPFFDYDPNKCVLCGICVQTCEDVQGVSALHFVGRGYDTKIAFFENKSRCESCGECVLRCPVGALIPKKA